MTWVVETPRLRLREMTPDDLDFIAAMLADPDVSRYYERDFTRADAEAWTRWRYDHVISLIRPVNVSSVNVARRIGMTEAGLVQFHGFEHIVFRRDR